MVSAATVNNPKKIKLFTKTTDLFSNYSQFAIVNMNNITAKQLQLIKMDWRDKANFLFGKNTIIAKALRELGKDDIATKLKGNVAVVFTNEDISELKNILDENRRESFAKVGDISQIDLFIQPQITNMGPEKTSYFQALNIATKITKGKVEIISKNQTLFKGKKVTPSQSNLLSSMGVKPFVYNMIIENVYDSGEFYNPEIIELSKEKIEEELLDVIGNVAAFSLGLDISNKATVPYELHNEARDAFAICTSLGLKDERFDL